MHRTTLIHQVISRPANLFRDPGLCCLPSFLRFQNAEQPPSVPFLSATRLPLEIDFHCIAGSCGDLEPVFADIPLGTAMGTLPGFAPGAEDGSNLHGPAPPQKHPRKSRFPDGHARSVALETTGMMASLMNRSPMITSFFLSPFSFPVEIEDKRIEQVNTKQEQTNPADGFEQACLGTVKQTDDHHSTHHDSGKS